MTLQLNFHNGLIKRKKNKRLFHQLTRIYCHETKIIESYWLIKSLRNLLLFSIRKRNHQKGNVVLFDYFSYYQKIIDHYRPKFHVEKESNR